MGQVRRGAGGRAGPGRPGRQSKRWSSHEAPPRPSTPWLHALAPPQAATNPQFRPPTPERAPGWNLNPRAPHLSLLTIVRSLLSQRTGTVYLPPASSARAYRSRTEAAPCRGSGTQPSQGMEPCPAGVAEGSRREGGQVGGGGGGCLGRAPRAAAGRRRDSIPMLAPKQRQMCHIIAQQPQRRSPGDLPPLPSPPRAAPAAAPVELARGGSPGLRNTQPVCLSEGSSGRVRCQVGCVTLSPTAPSRPFMCSAATQRLAQGQARLTYRG